ncbi:MAG: septum formation protein Maf [Alphaproteobacteria bacterium]|nr:septum formation protein Maf [Alphaproteobacteria bacterium]
MTLVLASGSPRRRQLLAWAGIPLEVLPTDVDESWVPGEDPTDAAERLARAKAWGPDGRVVLAADTVVHVGDVPFGKPEDRQDAVEMLRRLAGRWHGVTTGVAIRSADHALASFRVTTEVRMRDVSDAEIAKYVATDEPLDKAGAYGIQGIGGMLVAEVRGDWTNVMGLPLEATLLALAAHGITP